MSDDKSHIDIMDEGPFIVNNLEALENSNGQSIVIKKKIALCRCGASNNKPFCDGSHTKIGFSGIRESKIRLDKEKEYNGQDISIFYNVAVCYHARECVNNLPSVFDADLKPWVNPNGSDAGSIIDVIKKCPSGALSYKIGDEHFRDFDKNVKIRIEKTDLIAFQEILNLMLMMNYSHRLKIIMHFAGVEYLRTSLTVTAVIKL